MKRHYGRDSLGFPVFVSQTRAGSFVAIKTDDGAVLLDAKALRFVLPFLLSAVSTGSITPPKRKTKVKP